MRWVLRCMSEKFWPPASKWTRRQGRCSHSLQLPPQLLLLCRRPALNIWTPLIKSYLNSVLLSLTDSKVIKLLKGVAGESVVSRLKRERLIKRPLLLLTSSKSAFFSARRANVRECGFFFFLPSILFFYSRYVCCFSFFFTTERWGLK